MEYSVVPGSKGPQRSWKITVGLVAGYDTLSVMELEEIMEMYLRSEADAGRPVLPGTMTSGTIVYAWPVGSGSEPVIVVEGVVSPLYNKHLSDDAMIDAINRLAGELGRQAQQTRVYVEALTSSEMITWILQAANTVTPTGEALTSSEMIPRILQGAA